MENLQGLETIRHLEIAFGNECNQHCVYCYQEDQRAGHEIPELIWKKRLLPVYPHLDYVTIIGGEPTIMKSVRQMVAFLGKEFPHVNLATISNGKCFDGFWQDCFLKRGRKVCFSVNAATAATHARITQGSRFDDAIYNIARLTNRREQESSSLQIHLGFVVTRENHHEAADFIQLGEMLRVDRCTFNLDFVRNLRAEHSAIKASLKSALEIAATSSIGVVGLEEILRQLGEEVEFTKRSGDPDYYRQICAMPWQALDIRKDGSVSFCNAAWLSLGSLKHKNMEDLWNSPVAVKMRQLIAQGDYSMCKPDCTMNINPRLCGSRINYVMAARRCVEKVVHDPATASRKIFQKIRQRFQ